jgi:uncharacterized membrane protein
MDVFQITLILAIFLCSLVAGFLFAFSSVVMPGIRNLDDREFIRSFQMIDRVIQNNQPVFILVWVGSLVTLVASALFGFVQLDEIGRLLMIIIAPVYVLGVQLPTIAINVPMNNKLQTLVVDTMDGSMLETARKEFEMRWNRWNLIRTILACLVSGLLIVLLFII